MKLKLYTFIFLFSVTNAFFSQLIITEVYYDTPFNEKLKFGNELDGYVNAVKHHRGEFIEIYNYSDEDISLNNWYLKDLQGIFWFPDKTIKSQQFIVVAYSTLPGNTTVFSEHFPTTKGKETQIIYQNKIILRNRKDVAILGYRIGESSKMIDKSSVGWVSTGYLSTNFVRNAWANPQEFYKVSSIQYNPDYPVFNRNYTAAPNPLDATFTPAIQAYAELVRDDYLQNYSYLDWSSNVNALINNLCNITIPIVEQTPDSTLGKGERCFSHDEAGNYILSTDCLISISPNTIIEFSYDELEAIKNSIQVYPNPVTSNNNYIVNISWSAPSIDKISNLQVYNSGGGLVYGFTPSYKISSTTFSLQGQLPGVFVANFTLNTGQVISKNVLKW